MSILALSAKSTLVAGFSLVLLSSAMAMPAGVAAHLTTAAPLQRVAWNEHRVYPGSDSAEAQKARNERNAPNRFCQKQEQYCD